MWCFASKGAYLLEPRGRHASLQRRGWWQVGARVCAEICCNGFGAPPIWVNYFPRLAIRWVTVSGRDHSIGFLHPFTWGVLLCCVKLCVYNPVPLPKNSIHGSPSSQIGFRGPNPTSSVLTHNARCRIQLSGRRCALPPLRALLRGGIEGHRMNVRCLHEYILTSTTAAS